MRTTLTDAERKIWDALRDRRLDGYKFRRQHPVGPYFADFLCKEVGLVVELDGEQHFEPDAIEYDRRRTEWLRRSGYEVLRFDNRQALAETEGVLTAISQWLANR